MGRAARRERGTTRVRSILRRAQNAGSMDVHHGGARGGNGMVVMMNQRAMTSIDILRERDALRARIEELEEAMRRVVEETDHALANPERTFTSLCRVSTVSRHALGLSDD